MRRNSLFALAVVVVVALLISGCSKPPESQIQQATAAFQAAEAAGAATFAPEAWNRAKQAMDRLRAELDAQGKKNGLLRSYRQARVLADDAARLSRQAGTEAARKKEQLASDAAAAIADAKTRLQAAQGRLAALPRGSGLDIAALRSTLGQAAQLIAEAEADLGAERLESAGEKASQASELIRRVQEQMERVSGQSPSKKR